MPSNRYHHGDLPTSLIDVAIALISDKGVASLSLREIARDAGVSHGAPAHHFGDKKGLLTAVAAQGLSNLAAALQSAGEAAPITSYSRLVAAGEAYIRFYLKHPAYAAVMYRPDQVNDKDPAYAEAAVEPGRVLTAFIDEALRSAGRKAGGQHIEDAAIVLWSQVHGFANLWVSGNFGDPADSALLKTTLDRFFKTSVRF